MAELKPTDSVLDYGPITRDELFFWFGEERPAFCCDMWLDADERMTVGALRAAIRNLGEGFVRLRGGRGFTR